MLSTKTKLMFITKLLVSASMLDTFKQAKDKDRN